MIGVTAKNSRRVFLRSIENPSAAAFDSAVHEVSESCAKVKKNHKMVLQISAMGLHYKVSGFFYSRIMVSVE